jgi:hypothetical protein
MFWRLVFCLWLSSVIEECDWLVLCANAGVGCFEWEFRLGKVKLAAGHEV